MTRLSNLVQTLEMRPFSRPQISCAVLSRDCLYTPKQNMTDSYVIGLVLVARICAPHDEWVVPEAPIA